VKREVVVPREMVYTAVYQYIRASKYNFSQREREEKNRRKRKIEGNVRERERQDLEHDTARRCHYN
jgi:hypothetical protein